PIHEAAPVAQSGGDGRTIEVEGLGPMTAEKIRGLSQNQIPIEKRRALYNSMGRRVTAAVGLKPGLVEKYNAVASCRKERWNMLKEFIIDQDMSGVEVETYFVRESEKKREDRYEKLPLFMIEKEYGGTEAGRDYIEKIKASQAGESNPQFPDDDRFKIYKVFKKHVISSADITRGGTKTSASGLVTSKAGKKAISDNIDAHIAELESDIKKEGRSKPTGPKNGNHKDKKKDENKELQKDIKAFLIPNL
ncbi:unnamed protein product, partial [Durusdinium trenchii]